MTKKFGTVLNCIDGRTQIPVIKWMKEHYELDYVDTITHPGIDRELAQGRSASVQAIREKTEVSINAHGSGNVAVVGHHDCAANAVDKAGHIRDIVFAMKTVKSWGLPISVAGLWIDENWHVHLIQESDL